MGEYTLYSDEIQRGSSYLPFAARWAAVPPMAASSLNDCMTAAPSALRHLQAPISEAGAIGGGGPETPGTRQIAQ